MNNSTINTTKETENQAANIQLVRTFLAAGAAGDTVKFLETVDEAVVLHIPDVLPWGGDYHGHENLQKGFAAFSEAWETESLEQQFLADDAQVVILQRLKGRVKANDRTVDMPLAELFKIRNGKITEIRPFYFDGGKLAEVFR